MVKVQKKRTIKKTNLSLYPLKFEEALKAILKVKPKKKLKKKK